MPRCIEFTKLSLCRQPLLFISTSFAGGLVIAGLIQLHLIIWIVTGLGGWFLATMALRFRLDSPFIITALLIGTMGCGGLLWELNDRRKADQGLRRYFESGELQWESPIELWGTLIAAPEPAPDRYYLSIAVEKLSSSRREFETKSRVQILVPVRDEQSNVDYRELALDYGTRVRILCYLKSRRVFRNPGSMDIEKILENRGFDAAGSVKSPLLIENIGAGNYNPVLRIIYGIRSELLYDLLRSLRQPATGILAAALFGNRHFLTKQTGHIFREGGTYHLLVISGLHIGIIAVIALWFVRFFVNKSSIRYAVVILLVWAYALMVGAQPAVTRAALMLTMLYIGKLIFRNSPGTNSVAAAALVLLVINPQDLFNPAFQISFMTVLIIIVLTGPVYSRLLQVGKWQPSASTPYPPRVPRWLRIISEVLFWNESEFQKEIKGSPIRFRLDKSIVAVRLNRFKLQRGPAMVFLTILTTTGVQLGLLPLMVALFHRVSVISPLMNVIEAILMLALMITGAIFLFLDVLIGAPAIKPATIVNFIGDLVTDAGDRLVVSGISSIRMADFGDASKYFYVAYFVGIIIIIAALNQWNPLKRGDELIPLHNRCIRFLVIPALISNTALSFLLIFHPVSHKFESGRLNVMFLDVGQGDAMLVTFPQGSLMLLDSGGQVEYGAGIEGQAPEFVEDRLGLAEAAVLPALWYRGIDKLDWVAASHGDSDHVGAFEDILTTMDVGNAIVGKPAEARQSNTFVQAVKASGISMRSIKRGDFFIIDGVRIDTLWPHDSAGIETVSDNNMSLVLMITYKCRRFLLTGDIEKEAEARLVAMGSDLRADVLKVAHHGSKTSSTSEFLHSVKPAHAVVSAGNPSPFGHPHPVVIDRLRSIDAKVWETGKCGAITISTDGYDLQVATFDKCD